MDEIQKDAYQHLTNDRGMTLIEVVVSLAIFLVIVSIIPSVFSLWNKEEEAGIKHEELIIFFSQLQREFRENHLYWTNDYHNILYLSHGGEWDTVQYERYHSFIRRRVNGLGHEVFLQNVQRFQVLATSFGIEVLVEGVDGKEYKKILIHSSTLGEKNEQIFF